MRGADGGCEPRRWLLIHPKICLWSLLRHNTLSSNSGSHKRRHTSTPVTLEGSNKQLFRQDKSGTILTSFRSGHVGNLITSCHSRSPRLGVGGKSGCGVHGWAATIEELPYDCDHVKVGIRECRQATDSSPLLLVERGRSGTCDPIRTNGLHACLAAAVLTWLA